LSGLWTLHKFGKRAGLFPSDGKNIGIFPNSVRTCLSGNHGDTPPVDYMMGALQKERNNVIECTEGGLHDPSNPMRLIWEGVMTNLPHVEGRPWCAWPMLVPTHAWGRARVYEKAMGTTVTTWDPTNIAIPMQFHPDTLAPDGRLFETQTALNSERKRAWILSSLQDNSKWVAKQKHKWEVISIGNKRSARDGAGEFYIPERQLIEEYYTKHWGHLAFGYPLGDGGWWRMRYIHAAMAGIVTSCDPADASTMPPSYRRYFSDEIEKLSDEKLATLARQQHEELMGAAWSVEASTAVVDGFVKTLASK
jgi:hypothetical protein